MLARHSNIKGIPSVAYAMHTKRPQNVFGAMFPYPKIHQILFGY